MEREVILVELQSIRKVLNHFVSNKSFEKTVKKVLKRKYDANDAVLVLETTPKVFIDLGFNNYPMLMTQKHIKGAVGEKISRGHSHEIDKKVLYELPSLLEHPLLIAKSLSNDVDRENSFIAILEAKDKNNDPLLVAIRKNGKGYINKLELDTNFIKSVYGKRNYKKFYQQLVENNVILYKKR